MTPEERLAELGLSVPEVVPPVAAYLPSWDRDDKRHITLRHLLNHVSGALRCVG